MKKIKIFLLLIFSISSGSCNKDEAEIVITDFTKTETVFLEPYNWYPYSMISIEIKGYVNDTLKIKNKTPGYFDINLIGKIDTIWKTDYYGEGARTYIVDPYLATEGELKINFKL